MFSPYSPLLLSASQLAQVSPRASQLHIIPMERAPGKASHVPLSILYHEYVSPFGMLFIASTAKGVCVVAFPKDREEGVAYVRKLFPKAHLVHEKHRLHEEVVAYGTKKAPTRPIPVCLQGTPFQWKVWQALCAIPVGVCTTYGAIAESIGHPKAFRAVGTAVGKNPIAYLIPCHRVLPQDGSLGKYHWGAEKKEAMIATERKSL